jgi:hypothetical protein
VKRLGLCAAVAFLASSCGAGLSGSVSQFFALDYSRLEILRDADAFQVTYYRDTATEVDVVVRLTVVTTGFDFTPGHTFDLSGEYAPGHPRAVVTHAAGGEPARQLPELLQGTLTLDSGGTPGARTQGSFNLSFQETGGDFGEGATVSGDFDAVVQNAALPGSNPNGP